MGGVQTIMRDVKCPFSAWPRARCLTSGMQDAVGTERCPSRLCKGPQHSSAFCACLSYFGVFTTDYSQSPKKEFGGCCKADSLQNLTVLVNQQIGPHKERTILTAVSWPSARAKASSLLSSLCWGGRLERKQGDHQSHIGKGNGILSARLRWAVLRQGSWGY